MVLSMDVFICRMDGWEVGGDQVKVIEIVLQGYAGVCERCVCGMGGWGGVLHVYYEGYCK